MSVGEKLRAARKQRGWSLSDVADRIPVHRNQIYLYEAGERNPSSLALFGLAMLFGKPVDWFRSDDGFDSGPDAPDGLAFDPGPLHPIRIIGTIQNAMVFDNNDLGHIEVAASIIRQAPRAYALRSLDHSLALLRIHTGDMLIVDPDMRAVEDGRLYVAQFAGDDRARVCTLFRDGRRIRVVDHLGETLSRDPADVEVLGRIRWTMAER